MDPFVYAGFVAAGAIFLLIDAYRNFVSPLAYHPFELHPILRGVDVQKLCTGREWLTGYLFYSLLYLVSYAIILGSAEIYELVSNAKISLSEVGAIGKILASQEDTLKLGGSGYGKPIYVSAFLIAFLSIGFVKPIESTMRSLAHRLAGVPSGVYRTIQELRKLDYLELGKGYPCPLHRKFENFQKKHKLDGEIQSQVSDIDKSLAAIDCLAQSITGGMRSLHFPLADLEKLNEMTSKLRTELKELENELDGLDDTPDKIDVLHQKAASAANNTLAMFAVLYIRNNRSAMNVETDNPVDKTVTKIEQGYNPEQNSFAMAFFAAVMVSLFVGWFMYHDWTERRIGDNPALVNTQFTTAWASAPPEKPQLKKEGCKLDERKKRVSDSGTDIEKDKFCYDLQREASQQYLRDNMKLFLGKAFWDTFSTGLMVFLVAAMAVFGREVRREQNSWREWNFAQFPFLRMLSLSILPCLVAILAVVVGRFLQLYWDSGLTLTQTQIIQLFASGYLFFLMQAGSGLIISFTVLILMDKHDDLNWVDMVLFIGIISSIAYFIYTMVVFNITSTYQLPTPKTASFGLTLDHAMREGVVLSILPVTFILLFALMLEHTEANKNESQSVLSRMSQKLARLLPDRDKVTLVKSLVIGLVAFALLGSGMVAAQDAPSRPTAPETQADNEFAKLEEKKREEWRKNNEQAEKLFRIGVRSDARPFSFRTDDRKEVSTAATPGPLAQKNYSGYIVKICDAVLAQMLTQGSNASGLETNDIGIVNIDLLSQQRREQGQDVKGRFGYLGEDFDILCDPATITNDRRSDHMISAPLYLTGISYLSRRGITAPGSACQTDKFLIGVVGNTTATVPGIRAILDAGELPEYKNEMIKFLRGEETCVEHIEPEAPTETADLDRVGQISGIFPEVDQEQNIGEPAEKEEKKASLEPTSGLVKIFPNHAQAARAFCNGEIHYYVGGLEIIIANVRTLIGCDFDNGTRTYTNDRYAVFGKIQYGELTNKGPSSVVSMTSDQLKRMRHMIRFFEILAQKTVYHPSLIDNAFEDTFFPVEPSEKLEAFFWSVRGAPPRAGQSGQ